MNLYGCVFEGKQENHIVRLFVGCITVECSFVETFLGHLRNLKSATVVTHSMMNMGLAN